MRGRSARAWWSHAPSPAHRRNTRSGHPSAARAFATSPATLARHVEEQDEEEEEDEEEEDDAEAELGATRTKRRRRRSRRRKDIGARPATRRASHVSRAVWLVSLTLTVSSRDSLPSPVQSNMQISSSSMNSGLCWLPQTVAVSLYVIAPSMDVMGHMPCSPPSRHASVPPFSCEKLSRYLGARLSRRGRVTCGAERSEDLLYASTRRVVFLSRSRTIPTWR